MLESPSTSEYDDMDNCVSTSTSLEPTIKQSTKEKILGCREAQNLVSPGQNIRAYIPLMKTNPLKPMRGHSRYNTITKLLISIHSKIPLINSFVIVSYLE